MLSISAGIGLSIESDYFSFAKFVGISKTSRNRMQTYSADFQFFNDDLRWGRLNSSTKYGPAFLIYPKELRYQEWYDVFKRNTYNANLGFSQVLNKRNVLGISGILSYQKGLLETPFHRIYFSDGSLAVEQLPSNRYKGSLAFKLNSFINGNLILKNSISGYSDNFGIQGIALEHETALKLNSKWTLYGNARYYNQNASDYFAPYMIHQSDQEFYTSVYDLSAFNSLKIGFGAKYSPFKFTRKDRRFDSALLKYNYYKRSNDLDAHMISLSLNTTRFKEKNIKK
jgi:hypothetical protein